MTDALTLFPPRLQAARDRLAAFVPEAGHAYSQTRNFDRGPGRHSAVSTLSPYMKIRALDERAVARAVLAQHSAREADKFLAEVFWRTYWKGWMELRPGVWDQYMRDLKHLHDDVQTQSGLRDRWEAACLGQTGIAPFDAWAGELAQTGYLHNHARMWFASIWVFTLKLPWQLGADFFLRHLLDGDAAVNTLSWRWVAGLQTRGKTYLATPENIAKFSDGRFQGVTGLAEHAIPVDGPPLPDPIPLRPCAPLPLAKRYGVVVHEEDVDASALLAHAPQPQAQAYLNTTQDHSPWNMAPHVAAFRHQIAEDAQPGLPPLTTPQALADWAEHHNLQQIIAPYAPVGPVRRLFAAYRALPGAVPLSEHRRSLDSAAWPLATKGFFPFRKHIPRLISEFVQS